MEKMTPEEENELDNLLRKAVNMHGVPLEIQEIKLQRLIIEARISLNYVQSKLKQQGIVSNKFIGDSKLPVIIVDVSRPKQGSSEPFRVVDPCGGVFTNESIEQKLYRQFDKWQLEKSKATPEEVQAAKNKFICKICNEKYHYVLGKLERRENGFDRWVETRICFKCEEKHE